jgi:hypothetical protein
LPCACRRSGHPLQRRLHVTSPRSL